ncbi:MAG TPA: DMT family transporter, partial [Nitrospirota bacterium]|nr:DMT family transporter [Nitrospirota bacterium]
MLSLRLIFVSLVWGVNFAFIKYALRDFGPLSFTIARFLLAAAALFVLLMLRRVPLRVSREDRIPLIVLGLAGITFYSIFFMYGLRSTTASNSALLIAMSPLFAALIQTVRGKERLSR